VHEEGGISYPREHRKPRWEPGWKGTPPMLKGNMIAMFVSKPILEEIEGVLTGDSSLALAVFSYRR
jgi:hypothetical protein